jgi:hypothetical protein
MREITKRAPNGKIEGAELDSETARAMVNKRWQNEREQPEVIQAILAEAGYTADNPPPALILELVKKIPGQSQVGVSAAREFVRLAYGKDEGGVTQVVYPGERCPTCGQVQVGGLLDGDTALRLVELLARRG